MNTVRNEDTADLLKQAEYPPPLFILSTQVYSRFSCFYFAVATASSNHRQANMVVNATNSAPGQQTQEMKKQRAEMKKDLQRKFERWDKETHDRTR